MPLIAISWVEWTGRISGADLTQIRDAQLAIWYATAIVQLDALRRFVLAQPGPVVIEPSDEDRQGGIGAVRALQGEVDRRVRPEALPWAKFIDPSLQGFPELAHAKLTRLLKPRVKWNDSDREDLRAEGEAEVVAEYRRLQGPPLPQDQQHLIINVAKYILTLIRLDPVSAANRAICAAKYQRTVETRDHVPLDDARPLPARSITANAARDAAQELEFLKRAVGPKGLDLLIAHGSGLTIKQAAESVGMSERNAKYILAKARKRKKFLKPRK